MKRSSDGRFVTVKKCCHCKSHAPSPSTSTAESGGLATPDLEGTSTSASSPGTSSSTDTILRSSFVLLSKLPAAARREFVKENPWFKCRPPNRKFYLCTHCVSHFTALSSSSEPTKVSSSSRPATTTSTSSISKPNIGEKTPHEKCSPSAVDSILDQLDKCNDDELGRIVKHVAGLQRENIKHDIQRLQKSNSEIESLCQNDLTMWISKRNIVVREFLEGVAGKAASTRSTESEIAKTIEHIYHLAQRKSVLPICLSENLVSYSFTGSKSACEITSANSPSGSYPYLMSWLREQSHEPQAFGSGDILMAFDNDQVIGKTYHVRHDNKVNASIVTSVCIAEVDPTGTVQQDDKLKPVHWQTSGRLQEQVQEILSSDSTLNNAVDQTHYKELYSTVKRRISKVVEEQRMPTDEGVFSDAVDDEVQAIQQKREWKVCSECQAKNLKNKRVCIVCGCRLSAGSKSAREEDEQASCTTTTRAKAQSYVHVKFAGQTSTQSTRENKSVNVIAGDPIFVNPNSYQSLITVFKDIGKQAGIRKYVKDGTGGREWVVVTCDGLPYTLAQKVIRETYSCTHCQEAVFSRESYIKHVEEHSATDMTEMCSTDATFPLEFDWLLLKIGHGHVEMNMLRSFLELNWEVFMKDVAFCMGFRSEAAQKYAKSGGDHHKSWELLQIAFLGSLDELLVPYVREKLSAQSSPTPDDFLQWSRSVKNSRYKYLQEQILTYMQAILNLRAGIRHNDIAKVIAGRVKFANIFHARNHPKYQIIEITELCNFLAAPREVKKFLSDFQAISTSGDQSRCEDMDFVLENINKKSKSWIPKGVPTPQDWQRIFRNLGKLDKLRSSVLNRTTTTIEVQSSNMYSSSHQVHEEDVTAWRAHLRDSEFLLHHDSEVPFQSVSKAELDESLLTFTKQASNRRRYFARALFEDGRGSEEDGGQSSEKPQLVFVTPGEREHHTNICNQTKNVIAKRILEKISTLDDDSIKTMLLHEWDTSVKTGKKDDYIAFYQRVEEEDTHQILAVTKDLE